MIVRYAIAGVWDSEWNSLNAQLPRRFQNTKDYYDGQYNLGPVTDYSQLNNFFSANPGAFTLDVSGTHLGSDSANYNLTERVTAAYVMNTLQFGRSRSADWASARSDVQRYKNPRL